MYMLKNADIVSHVDPQNVLTVRYEDLNSNFELTMSRILEMLRLPLNRVSALQLHDQHHSISADLPRVFSLSSISKETVISVIQHFESCRHVIAINAY